MDYYNITSERYVEIAKKTTIHPKFKIELLDWNENVIDEITGDLSITNAGSLSANYQQGLWRSCTLTLCNVNSKYNPDPYKNIFWINSKFKLYIGLYDIDYDDIYWFSQGVFLSTNPVVDRTNKIITINGVDKFGFLGSESGYTQLDGTYKIPAGNNTYQAIRDTLHLGLGNGYYIDPIPPKFDYKYKDEILPYDINKAPESYMGEMFIEMANVLGCDIYYDTNGALTISSGTLDMFYDSKSAIWSFSNVQSDYLNTDTMLTLNTTDVYNVVKVVGTNINDMTYTYTAKNYNPKSDTNIHLIGEKPIYIESPNIYNDDRAKDYAELKLKQNSILQQSFSFSCSLLPHLQPNEVIEITDSYFNFDKQRFIIQDISIPIDYSGTMTISACNISSLPYYEFEG